MNICLVYQAQYPWDIRVEKFCNVLTSGGDKVYLVSRNDDSLEISEELSQNLYIKRLPFHKNKIINKIINTPAFFSIFWIREIYRVVKNNECKLIIVRDLPLALACTLVSKLRKIPVIMDMAEDYPEMIADTWKYGNPKKIDCIIRNPYFLKILEKVSFKYLNHIIVVSRESKDRLVSIGVNSNKISVVYNTPTLNNVKSKDTIKKIRDLSPFNLLYVGGLEETRGLEIVIRALPLLKNKLKLFSLIIVGVGSSMNFLKSLANELEVSEHVHFLGWCPHETLPNYIRSSDVCLVPHYVTKHTDTTLPNKIYDYMMHKKPVLVTNSKSLKNLIEESGSGLYYVDKNPLDLSEKLYLLSCGKLREEFGFNGEMSIINKYNWATDSAKLRKIINLDFMSKFR